MNSRALLDEMDAARPTGELVKQALAGLRRR